MDGMFIIQKDLSLYKFLNVAMVINIPKSGFQVVQHVPRNQSRVARIDGQR